jgi:hypothetical protein
MKTEFDTLKLRTNTLENEIVALKNQIHQQEIPTEDNTNENVEELATQQIGRTPSPSRIPVLSPTHRATLYNIRGERRNSISPTNINNSQNNIRTRIISNPNSLLFSRSRITETATSPRANTGTNNQPNPPHNHTYGVGEASTARNSHSYGVGETSTARNSYSHGVGESSTARNIHSHGVGESSTARNIHSHGVEESSTARNNPSHAVEEQSQTSQSTESSNTRSNRRQPMFKNTNLFGY